MDHTVYLGTNLIISSSSPIDLLQSENYGDIKSEFQRTDASPPPPNALKSALMDKRILSLGLTSCFFEGTMYLFVFFWTPNLEAAHSNPQTSSNQTAQAADLPLGIIFAAFMSSTMLGSLVFNLLVSKYRFVSHSRILITAMVLASVTLLLPVFVKNKIITFCAFCLFEAGVGLYWPSVGYLKANIVEDSVRGRVYGLLRVPVNVLVVLVLSLVKEGSSFRDGVFVGCIGALLITAGVLGLAVEASPNPA